ncbi:MAG: hypothetical protein K8S56_06760 [Candidatus Cloacimonetes bacterium]|nr:hypothetical protein [Candidatus Cloacimonadota bacterium]
MLINILDYFHVMPRKLLVSGKSEVGSEIDVEELKELYISLHTIDVIVVTGSYDNLIIEFHTTSKSVKLFYLMEDILTAEMTIDSVIAKLNDLKKNAD